MIGPNRVPTPPLTAISSTRMERDKAKTFSGSTMRMYCEKKVPAMAMNPADIMKATVL